MDTYWVEVFRLLIRTHDCNLKEFFNIKWCLIDIKIKMEQTEP